MDAVAPEYVAARRVLLDALEALADHLPSLVLVGAQAVYHHTGDADLNVPLMTTDADLAIDTRGLADAPDIGAVLRGAGFVAGTNPGHWVAPSDVAVDLIGVPHQAGTQKQSARAARLAPHNRFTARIARGLEPALVDHERSPSGRWNRSTLERSISRSRARPLSWWPRSSRSAKGSDKPIVSRIASRRRTPSTRSGSSRQSTPPTSWSD